MYAVIGLLFLCLVQIDAVAVPLKDLATNNICNDDYRKSLPKDLREDIKCFDKYDDSDAKNKGATQNVCDGQTCACYFQVKGATDKSNVGVGKDKVKFSVSKAREICDQYNATLPTIHDPYEYSAAVDALIKKDGCGVDKDDADNPVALGMVKGDNDQIGSWDDGFAPSNTWESNWYKHWEGNNSAHAHDTFTVTDGNNLYTYRVGDTTDKVLVICKQELLGRRVGLDTHGGPLLSPVPDDHGGQHGKNDGGGAAAGSVDHGKNSDDHSGKNTAGGSDDHGDHGKNPVVATPDDHSDHGKDATVVVTPAAAVDAHVGNVHEQPNGAGNMQWSVVMILSAFVIGYLI